MARFDNNNNQNQTGWSQDGAVGLHRKQQHQKTLKDFFPTTRLQNRQPFSSIKDKDPLFFPVENITPEELVKAGGRAKVIVNDKEVALICHENIVYGIQAKCPHIGGPLFTGDIEDVPGCGPSIRCPWHSWTFSLTTGICIHPGDRFPDTRMEVFPIKLNGAKEEVKIGFKEISPKIFATPPE